MRWAAYAIMGILLPNWAAWRAMAERDRRLKEQARLVEARYRSASLARADIRRYPHLIDGEVTR
jgi:hypothetical protein